MQLYKIHKYYVVANSLEQAKEAVKDKLPASFFSESICPVDVVAVEHSVHPTLLNVRDTDVECPECGCQFDVPMANPQSG